MHIRPTSLQPRLYTTQPPVAPLAQPVVTPAAVAPVAPVQPTASGAPGDLVDQIVAGISAFVQKIKEALKPAPQAPADDKAFNRRSDWFISQYESKSNPNEDTPGNANCGPTALTMIAKAFGKIAPGKAEADAAIEESRLRMAESQNELDYTSTTGLQRGAQSYGLDANVCKMADLDSMRQELDRGRLLIANVVPKYLSESNTGGHFAVVTKIKDGKVYMNDPASQKGPIVVSESAFMRSLAAQNTYTFVSVGQ